MHTCPALAYHRDEETGAVLIDPGSCIGCRYCSWVCPYGAPTFEPERGVMSKCTFCVHRLKDGLGPACADLCPTGALDFARVPSAELCTPVEGFPRTDLGPAIRIERVRRAAPPPQTAFPAPLAPVGNAVSRRVEPVITFGAEWSLAAFTYLVIVMFGVFTASASGAMRLHPAIFATAAALAGGLSLAHLGRPARAWRAVLNVRGSWLSREVIGFGSFAVAGAAALVAGARLSGGLTLAAWLVGLFTLVAIDQVYRPVYWRRNPVLDGGGALLTGLYLAGLFTGLILLAAPAWALKLAGETLSRRPTDSNDSVDAETLSPLWFIVTRLVLGLAVPAAAWAWGGTPLGTPALGAAIVGEAMGRASFYNRLAIQSPARQVRADVVRRLASWQAAEQP
jgi:DMSO reductase anchor subunit/ferredoxin